MRCRQVTLVREMLPRRCCERRPVFPAVQFRASCPRHSVRCNQAAGDAIEVDVSVEAAPAVFYDALALPDRDQAISALRADGRTLEFIKSPEETRP